MIEQGGRIAQVHAGHEPAAVEERQIDGGTFRVATAGQRFPERLVNDRGQGAFGACSNALELRKQVVVDMDCRAHT